MQVHFYVVSRVLDVVVLFDAAFPNGFVVVVVEAGDVKVVVPFLLFDVADFVSDDLLDAMQVLVDDRFVVIRLVGVVLCQMISSMQCKYLWMIDLL